MRKDGKLKWALMPLLLVGVVSELWEVDQQPHVCAVKGSSVVIPCSYVYPDRMEVQSVMWGHERHNIYVGPFIYHSKENHVSTKFQYIGDTVKNCSFRILQVVHNDSGKYTFRFTSESVSKKDQWTSKNPSILEIVDLKITVTESKGATKEGDSLNLTCRNSCDGGKPSSAFSWFNNGEFIKQGPTLSLWNILFLNSGNYTCSLEKHAGTTSGIFRIDVEYGPKNTSVSVTPSADINAKVTLICSSHANPPVKSYTWFKIRTAGNIAAIGHKTPRYFVEFMENVDDQYFCMATNKHGSQNSSTVTLGVEAHVQQPTVTLMKVTVIVALFTLTIGLAIRRYNKRRISSSETECEVDAQSLQNVTYVNWPVDNIHSRERNQREGELVCATMEFTAREKSDVMQQVDFLHDSVTYSAVCRT